MLQVTAQGIIELKGILEQMQCSGCGDEHAQGESCCSDEHAQGESCCSDEHAQGESCCGDEHAHGESCCSDEQAPVESGCGSHCGCGCEGHADAADECAMGELALRLVVMGDHGFGLIPDIFRDGDQVIEHDGAKVLLVDSEIAKSVNGLILDCVDVPGGRALTFIPGKA